MASSNHPHTLALTGYAGAGKDAFAGLLRTGFEQAGRRVTTVSSGDLIRQYVRDHQLGDPADRALLRRVVDEVAKDHGYTYWLEQSLAQAEDYHIDILLYPGLRQSVEVELLHRRGDKVVVIDVPAAIRYEWAKKRARPGDEVDFATFKVNEEAERAGTAQQLDAVIAAADCIIRNDGSFAQLEAVAEAVTADFPEHLQPQYLASSQAA